MKESHRVGTTRDRNTQTRDRMQQLMARDHFSYRHIEAAVIRDVTDELDEPTAMRIG